MKKENIARKMANVKKYEQQYTENRGLRASAIKNEKEAVARISRFKKAKENLQKLGHTSLISKHEGYKPDWGRFVAQTTKRDTEKLKNDTAKYKAEEDRKEKEYRKNYGV